MTSRGWQNNWNASRGGRHQFRGNRPHHYGNNFNSSQRDTRGVEWQQNNASNPSARRTYQGDPQQVQYQASHNHPEQNYYSNRNANDNSSRGVEWQPNNASNPAARRTYQGDPQQAEYQAPSHNHPEQNYYSNRNTNGYPYASSGGDALPLPVVSATTSSSGQANHLPLQQRSANPSIKEVISSKKFEDLTFEEKLREQLSQVTDYEYFRLESLPLEITLLPPDENDREKAVKAAENAIEKVMERQKKIRKEFTEDDDDEHEDEDESMNESDDLDDDDDADWERGKFKKRKANDPDYDYTREEIKSFSLNLPNNFVFTMGFDVKGIKPKDEENCWCPCGNHMLPWRHRFGLNDLVTKYKFTSCGKGKSRFTPMGLMAHLEAKKESCVLHYCVDEYLRELYGDLRGTGHKALFKLGDPDYKVAEAAENEEKERLYKDTLLKLKEEERKNKDLQKQIRQKEDQLKEYMEKLKEVNPDRSNAMDHLIDNFETLGFDKHAIMPDYEMEDLVEKEEAFNDLMDKTLRMISLGMQQLDDSEKITITISQSLDQATFDINQVMDNEYKKWKQEKAKDSGRKIFETESEHTWKFVNNWIVNFTALNNKNKRKVIKEESTAIDGGGPTRQFLSQLWSQIERLAVSHYNKRRKKENKIKLFSLYSGGIWPEPNLNIEEGVKKATDGESIDVIAALNERIDRYYNVIGIMLFCSIVGEHSISSKVMGRFMRNVLLRNCEPRHKDRYPAAQVLKDCQDLGVNEEIKAKALLSRKIGDLADDWCFEKQDKAVSEQKITKENFSTLFMQMAFVESRRRAIDSIKKGISLYGEVDLARMVFSMTPIDVISKRLFAKVFMSTDDVIDRLRIRDERVEYDEGSPLDIKREKHQDAFFEGPFLETIRELSGDQLSSFFEFCTGYNYIPQNPEFHIEVEFSLDGDEDLPVSHTCVQHLRLPRSAYNGNKMVFKKKLLQSLSNGLRMTMM